MKPIKWIAAVVITVLFVLLARYLGPNHRYTVQAEGPGFTISHKAPRVCAGENVPAVLELRLTGSAETIKMMALAGWDRKQPGQMEFLVPDKPAGEKQADGSTLYTFQVKPRPWATKYDYYFRIQTQDGRALELKKDNLPMMVKFRGDVPAWLQFLHIATMFAGFLLVIVAAFSAASILRGADMVRETFFQGAWGWLLMMIGGLPLGFMMNWYAFRVMWEAWPFGGDVTDNKTQLALLAYAAGLVVLRVGKNKRAAAVLLASTVAVIVVYLIPHSL